MRGSLDFMDRVYIESIHWSGDLQVETKTQRQKESIFTLFLCPHSKKKGGGGENEKKKVKLY